MPNEPKSTASAKVNFKPATAKLMIGSLDDTALAISAQYNPREVTIAQGSAWHAHEKADTPSSSLHLEFGATQPRTMAVELLFDGYESQGQLDNIAGNVDDRTRSRSVEQAIQLLQTLASARPERKRFEDRRPHFCVVVWGTGGIPSFTCVIASLQTKYQAFTSGGKVLRATCTVQLEEACRVDLDDQAPLNQGYASRMAGQRRLRMLGLRPA